ncbi:hypothetical protein P5Y53_11150 [Dyella jiangningensis]|uniref:hypothetical protein n=1 Tax=Dyella jiangningensis TaxID=1379159 RepID=UPI0024104451|nr:hypothetical protein [Dyella jiangningensis]MDG2538221.1 hypothetical protein [Dyella jiangningensis]
MVVIAMRAEQRLSSRCLWRTVEPMVTARVSTLRRLHAFPACTIRRASSFFTLGAQNLFFRAGDARVNACLVLVLKHGCEAVDQYMHANRHLQPVEARISGRNGFAGVAVDAGGIDDTTSAPSGTRSVSG